MLGSHYCTPVSGQSMAGEYTGEFCVHLYFSPVLGDSEIKKATRILEDKRISKFQSNLDVFILFYFIFFSSQDFSEVLALLKLAL